MVIIRYLGLREIREKGCEEKRFKNLYLYTNFCSHRVHHVSIGTCDANGSSNVSQPTYLSCVACVHHARDTNGSQILQHFYHTRYEAIVQTI